MNFPGPTLEKRAEMGRDAETERVWDEMHERLLSYISARVTSIEDAEDILQDVFVRIHAHIDELRDTQSITSWIYQITRNAITDYHRKRATATRAFASLSKDADDASGPAGDRSDLARTASDEFTRCLDPLLNELPEHYREAITLTELKGLSQRAAAGQLGLSVSGMKSRVRRGRSKLKDVILDCCSVELDRREGLVDYQRREGSVCKDCECD